MGRLEDLIEALDLATELMARGDDFVELCSRISGIEFDPEDPDGLSLDEWFHAALDELFRRARG